MKRNESKTVVSVIAAAVFAMLVAGCASIGASDEAGEANFSMPVDRGTGGTN